MTLDELLELAGLAGGTAPDPQAFRPTSSPTPPLGAGMDVSTGYPRAIGGAPMAPAVEPGLRLPGPGGAPDRPGSSSFLERLATVGGVPHIPYYGGENGSRKSPPIVALLALASGALNARAKLAGADKLERLTFADRQDRQVAERKKERDQAFLTARGHAETLRKEKGAIREQRISQMTTALRDRETRLQAWKLQANQATTPEQLDTAKRQANSEQQAIDKINRDLSGLTGQSQLEQAGIEVPSEVAGLPTKVPKPPKESTGGEGSFATFQTPEGPKYMRQAEGARLGLIPTNTRESRVPSAAEKEQMTGDIGMLQQINYVREKFSPQFVGLGKKTIGKGQELIGAMGRGESDFRSSMQAIENNILKLRSGAAVTPQEAERLLKELPTFDLPPRAWKARMEAFERYYRTLSSTRRDMIGAFGVDLKGAPGLPDSYVSPARPDPNAPPDSVTIEITRGPLKGQIRVVSREKLPEAIRHGAKEVQ